VIPALAHPVAAHGTPGSTALAPDLVSVHYFDPAPPVVRYERILRIQGYSDLERVRPAITSAAREMADLASALSRPRAAYTFVPIRRLDADGVELEGAVRLVSRAFAPRLADCFEVTPVVLSVGETLGSQVVDLTNKGDLLEAVLLETAGWLCIEDATRQLTSLLREQALARQCRITSRMGPGYSYRLEDDEEVTWPLETQPALFSLFGAAQLPVSLMSSCAMQPKLSRSGLYGIAPLSPVLTASNAASQLN
jgi:hypothetical protein